jgi:hypothetical protein
LYPIDWPDSFAEFVLALHDLFPATKSIKTTKFVFNDSCEFPVSIVSESTFKALTPKHRKIAPAVDVYYVTLESWVV